MKILKALLSDIVKLVTNGEPADGPESRLTHRRKVIAAVILLLSCFSLILSIYSVCLSYKQWKIQEAMAFQISAPNIHVQIDGATEWSEAVLGVTGDTVNYRIEVKNIGDLSLENVLVRATLPPDLQYINGSTKVYNTSSRGGVTVSDNIVTNSGINIGDYGSGGNAWIYFSAKIAVAEENSGKNRILRSLIEVSGGAPANYSSTIDVAVEAVN